MAQHSGATVPESRGVPCVKSLSAQAVWPAQFQRAPQTCPTSANRARVFSFFSFAFSRQRKILKKLCSIWKTTTAIWPNGKNNPQSLFVHAWPKPLRNAVETDFVAATAFCQIKSANCPVRPASTNQSIGNQVEEYTISKLNGHFSAFSIAPCKDAGYPDKTLTQKTTRLKMPLEFKSSRDWNPNDANRRVLTSSSKKLRRQFTAPIHHLLLTVLYSSASPRHVTIKTIRLDFLEPSTAVNVRLEASVNHKILANVPHHGRII